MKTGFWLAAFVPALALCLPCGADIHYVSPTGSASPPYTNWTDAATAIQAAVNAAAAGDTVLVTNGTYHLTAEIVVTNAITIGSVHGPDVTTVDGQGTTRCFSLGSSACLLSGFTITHGRADLASPGERGAGVYCLNGTPAVSNCTFAGNHANGFGGGHVPGHGLSMHVHQQHLGPAWGRKVLGRRPPLQVHSQLRLG